MANQSAPTEPLSRLSLTQPAGGALQPDDPDARAKRNKEVFGAFGRTKDGTLKMLSEEEMTRQRGVVWELVKSVGNSLLEGRELTNITLPVTLFEPTSFLERMAQSWLYAPTYLTRAACSTDPIERMKLVVTFLLAGIHFAPAERKPFNPILGETFEAHFADGMQVFCEQISHHPPRSAFQVVGPRNCFMLSGYGKMGASARGNSVRGFQEGPNNIDFADGTRITFTLPTLVIGGILFGERTLHYEGTITFRDEKNRLQCDVAFNPDSQGFLKSLFKRPKSGADAVRGELWRTDGRREPMALLDGSWLSALDWDGRRYWTLDTDLPHLLHRPAAPLSSDCRHRDDLLALRKGDFVEGAECKLLLEERQRYDAKLRQAYRTPRATKQPEKPLSKARYRDQLADEPTKKKLPAPQPTSSSSSCPAVVSVSVPSPTKDKP